MKSTPARVKPKTKRAVKPAAKDTISPVAQADAEPRALEIAIGAQVRAFRLKRQMAVTELARLAGLSNGMLSKVESGQTSPSLATLRSLANALGVPVTTLFRKFEEQRDAIFVKAGGGLTIERHGARAGYTYQLLGHSIAKAIAVEPYLAVLTEMSEVYPLNQHPGVEFIYVLSGEMVYRHGDKLYTMGPGDSVFFDADAPHGPEELKRVPVQMLAVLVSPRMESDDK